MLNSVGKICQIDSRIEDEMVVYDVISDDPCGGFELYISTAGNSSPEYRLEAETEWLETSGQVKIEKDVASGYPVLFIYLQNPDTGEAGEAVQVYTQEAKVKQWYLLEDGTVVFHMDAGPWIREGTSKLLLSYKDWQGVTCYQEMSFLAPRITLESVGKWKGEESFSCSLQYLREGQARVFSAPSEEHTILIAAPIIKNVEFDGSDFVAEGDFYPNAGVSAQLWEDGVLCETAQLNAEGKMHFSFQGWNPQAEYQLSFQYTQKSGSSLAGGKIPVEINRPSVSACSFNGDFAIIEMDELGTYELKPKAVCVEGSKIYLQKETTEAVLRRRKGMACGPEWKQALESPGFYHCEYEGRRFYFWGIRPDSVHPEKEIRIQLHGFPESILPYQGQCLKLEADDEKQAVLVIGTERYTMSKQELREDYQRLCQALSEDADALCQVQQALAEHLPVSREEILFYQYQCEAESGYTALRPGMRLLLLPERNDIASVSYSITKRGGELTVDLQAKQMGYRSPFVSRMIWEGNQNPGGSVDKDLISAPFLGLAYPRLFAGRGPDGEQLYQGNYCLIAAETQGAFQQAVAELKEGRESSRESRYHCFRGHDAVSVQIRIQVDGIGRWVSLGACLYDILAETGAGTAKLYRRAKGRLCPVAEPGEEMPLLMGDQIVLGEVDV